MAITIGQRKNGAAPPPPFGGFKKKKKKKKKKAFCDSCVEPQTKPKTVCGFWVMISFFTRNFPQQKIKEKKTVLLLRLLDKIKV